MLFLSKPSVLVIFLLVNISTLSFCCFNRWALPFETTVLFRSPGFCMLIQRRALCMHVVLAPITHACSIPHMFLARRLCSVKHYVRTLYNVYGASTFHRTRHTYSCFCHTHTDSSMWLRNTSEKQWWIHDFTKEVSIRMNTHKAHGFFEATPIFNLRWHVLCSPSRS